MTKTKTAPTPAKSSSQKAARKVSVPEAGPAELRIVPIGRIQPAADNHRKTFDESELHELSDSIRQHGVLQPLLLRLIGNEGLSSAGNQFEIIAGERRWRAAQMAGLKEVPAQIVDRSGLSGSLAMLHENIMRVDLNPIERAEAIRRLMDEHGLTQAEVGELVGVQQGQISNELRLLRLPESLRARVADGRLAPTLIRTILPVADIPSVVDEIAKSICKTAADELVDVNFLQDAMRQAVLKQTRCMRVTEAVTYLAPKATDRHFSKISPDQEKLLDVREFKFLQTWDGQKRALNVELFDELNKVPYQNRLKKHKEYKAGQKSSAPKKSSKLMFESEYKVRNQLEIDCCELLANALESCKDKAAARTVSLTLMAMSETFNVLQVDGTVFDWNHRAEPILKELSVTPAQQDQVIRTAMVAELRENFSMPVSETLVLAKALGIDLLQIWTPSDALFETLTDEGRMELVEFGGEIGWPPGLIPPFLQEFFPLVTTPEGTKSSKRST